MGAPFVATGLEFLDCWLAYSVFWQAVPGIQDASSKEVESVSYISLWSECHAVASIVDCQRFLEHLFIWAPVAATVQVHEMLFC